MKSMNKTRKMALLANFLAIAIVLNIVESFVPIIPVPGAKLGLANIVTLIILYIYSFKEGFAITLLRVGFVFLLGRASIATFMMSLSGAMFAIVAMGMIKRTNFFGVLGVSVIGSVFHSIGQIVAGVFVIGSSAVVFYLPIMLLVSVPAGALTGIIAKRFLVIWKTTHNEIEIIN
jgi:heptaprenyl diphosphate synthase